MLTSKQRAELRAQANGLEVTLMVGKEGVTGAVAESAVGQLENRELIKGRVLETAGLTAREASDAICQMTGAEGVSCVGYTFVIYRRSKAGGTTGPGQSQGACSQENQPRSSWDPAEKSRRQAAKGAQRRILPPAAEAGAKREIITLRSRHKQEV